MKYFYDTEFLEGTQKKWGSESLPTIDLISIGIVCEDGREYYAISKDFNLKEAWNRYDLKEQGNFGSPDDKPTYGKVYWIRENVLRPIWGELENPFTYKGLKGLIDIYGKSRKQIAKEVIEFCKPIEGDPILMIQQGYERIMIGSPNMYIPPVLSTEWIGKRTPPVFYGYYSAYDHVALCWLFGKMIDLPKGFPMYTRDLKQLKDEIIERAYNRARNDFEKKLILDMDSMQGYPKQTNKHNALADARWNKQLHEFLKQL